MHQARQTGKTSQPKRMHPSSVSVERIQTQVSHFHVVYHPTVLFRVLPKGFSVTSESQGPVDFASTHLLASEDSNSLYEPGAKRMKTD